MREVQQISRRTWLARVAWGSFAVWSEFNFGLGRRGWGIAIGDHDLASGLAHAQSLAPAQALRVNMGFVNAYVLIRGKEAAVARPGSAAISLVLEAGADGAALASSNSAVKGVRKVTASKRRPHRSHR